MLKKLFKFFLAILVLITVAITYLSFFGIKTNKFNNIINEKIKIINPELNLLLNDVYLKINIPQTSININTSNSKININNSSINVSKIEIDLDIFKYLSNNYNFNFIKINFAENKIKNVTNFLNKYYFDLKRYIIFSQIEDGFVNISLNIIQNEIDNKNIYNISGDIKDARINFFNKYRISNINFKFTSNIEKTNIENLKFNYSNIDFSSENIIFEDWKNLKVKGDLKNDIGSLNLNIIEGLLSQKLDFLDDKPINIKSDNKFSFSIKNNKIEKLKILSSIEFKNIEFNKKYKSPVYLKNGLINSSYEKNNLIINLDGNYEFLNKEYNNINFKNKIKVNLKKNNNNTDLILNFDNKENIINTSDIYNLFEPLKIINLNEKIKFSSQNKLEIAINAENKLKIKNFSSTIDINEINIRLNNFNIKKYFPEYKNKINLINNLIQIDYINNKWVISSKSKYFLNNKNNLDDLNFKIEKKNNEYKILSNIKLDQQQIYVSQLNFIKRKNQPSSLSSNINIKNKYIIFDNLEFNVKNNFLNINNLKLKKTNFKFDSLEFADLKFENKENIPNQLYIKKNNNNYLISGQFFDGTFITKNIIKNKNSKTFSKMFHNLNSKINFKIDKIFIDKNTFFKNFKGYVKFRNNKIETSELLSVINKKDKFKLNIKTISNNEKITKLYIDKPEPFIKNYKFIKGFKEGNLTYESISINEKSRSKLNIYNFKIREVPILAKILTLASLQGIADLLTGEGIRFNEFEMDYITNKNKTEIKELFAIGPAISILMDGYIVDNEITSLRGTLVPATTINKSISKIPLIGDILVGKKVGEGVFGVSFKIKGPPKKLKTSVNPIKTLTPRFITRTLEKISN